MSENVAMTSFTDPQSYAISFPMVVAMMITMMAGMSFQFLVRLGHLRGLAFGMVPVLDFCLLQFCTKRVTFIIGRLNFLFNLHWLIVFSFSTAFSTVTLKRGIRPQIGSLDYDEK